jgi:hypothetical protein
VRYDVYMNVVRLQRVNGNVLLLTPSAFNNFSISVSRDELKYPFLAYGLNKLYIYIYFFQRNGLYVSEEYGKASANFMSRSVLHLAPLIM